MSRLRSTWNKCKYQIALRKNFILGRLTDVEPVLALEFDITVGFASRGGVEAFGDAKRNESIEGCLGDSTEADESDSVRLMGWTGPYLRSTKSEWGPPKG